MIFKAYLVLWVQSEICGCGFRKELVAKQFLLCGGLFCCFGVGFFVWFWGLVWFFNHADFKAGFILKIVFLTRSSSISEEVISHPVAALYITVLGGFA